MAANGADDASSLSSSTSEPSASPRRLFLIRHGETEGQSSVRYYGSTDIPLSDLGRAQMRALGEHLADLLADLHGRDPEHSPPAALCCSPLDRARESAHILLAALARPPAVVEPPHDGLREVDFGRFEGFSADEIRGADPDWFRAWRAGETAAYPDGDSIAGFAARVAAAVDDVLLRHPSGDLLLVAHRGVVKMAMAHLLGLSWSAIRHWPLDLASATVLLAERGWVLERYNATGRRRGPAP